MLTLDQLAIHKDYRKYLRIQEGIKGNMLNTLINATEKSLPALIREHIKKDFVCIYDDIYTIEELLTFSLKLKSDDEILAGYAGYISYKALEAYIRFYANKIGIDLSTIQISEKENGNSNNDIEHQMVEGRLMEDKVLRRVRNRAARQKCLEKSNFTCSVCGFNFYKVYGEIGKDFIEVHHTKPLSSYNEEHEVLQSELVALCSNCHSMVHRRRPMPYSIDEIKRILEENSIK
jgi:5-methylcytosine-specific restriction endonuclease McrA